MSEEGARRRCKAALLTSTRARVQPSWTSRSETTSEPLRIRGGGAATNDACRDVGDGGEEGQNDTASPAGKTISHALNRRTQVNSTSMH